MRQQTDATHVRVTQRAVFRAMCRSIQSLCPISDDDQGFCGRAEGSQRHLRQHLGARFLQVPLAESVSVPPIVDERSEQQVSPQNPWRSLDLGYGYSRKFQMQLNLFKEGRVPGHCGLQELDPGSHAQYVQTKPGQNKIQCVSTSLVQVQSYVP